MRIGTIGERAGAVRLGRTMPTTATVSIGSGKQMEVAVLFLDICGFSSWPNVTYQEQKVTLAVLQLFLSEMMLIVREQAGQYEKNTGDGLMAYFGTDTSDQHSIVRSAADAAVLMQATNDRVITPELQLRGIEPVKFRIGMDFGKVTIGRIGVHGINSLAAIGTIANVACHLMDLAGANGICIGGAVYHLLPEGWQCYCYPCPEDTGYKCANTDVPYPAWQLDYVSLQGAFAARKMGFRR